MEAESCKENSKLGLMDKIDFEVRLGASYRYHSFWARHEKSSWLEIFFEISSNSQLGNAELLILLDPKWHDQLGIQPQSDPRGSTSFPSAGSIAQCRSHEIWAYTCPYLAAKIEVDHIFPYSKGGSTSNDNSMSLCYVHNRAKSTDVHLLPWETFPQRNWIRLQLTSLIAKAQPLTKENLYFPKSQLRNI
jgi:hypothetical protein